VRRHRRNVAGTKENRKRGQERWFEEDNAIESKMMYNRHFSPQPVNRLESRAEGDSRI